MKFKIQLLFLLICHFSFAQKKQVINNEATSFSLERKKDTIEFLVIDQELTSKKPIFLWCQGSQPVPLYINFKKEGLWMDAGGIRNFDFEEIKKHYHLVVISMPQTPLIVDETKINSGYSYYGDSPNKDIPSVSFQKADFYQNYVDRALEVIQFLRKKSWVDNSKLIVVGHSQGAKVATGVAVSCKHVTKLGIFGANPLGRIDESIRRIRKDAESGKISWAQADKDIEKQYEFYQAVNDPEKVRKNTSLISWKSFSEPQLYDWLAFDKPIYLAYGTSDLTSDFSDLVPLYFIRENKHNLTYKRYLNLDHNFFEVKGNKEVDYNKPHWKEVMSSFVKWTLQ